jgi:uncharacterized protein YceK
LSLPPTRVLDSLLLPLANSKLKDKNVCSTV